MSKIKIAIDAGHGGTDSGAAYNGRFEKNDNLKLAMAVGEILEDNGYDVFYTRDNDVYNTPFEKATKANNSDADYFVSFHRNSSETANKNTGVEVLVYNDTGIKHTLAENVGKELEKIGFKNLGISVRPNLVVLKRTKMPAILIETGFINNDNDNEMFDNSFNQIAAGIADGIMDSIDPNRTSATEDEIPNPAPSPLPESKPGLYRVQVGAYKNRDNADRMLNALLVEGFPAFIIYEDGYFKVQVGAFSILSNAIKMEQRLRLYRYSTFIVYS